MPHVGNFPERGYPKPLAMGPEHFGPLNDTYQFFRDATVLRNSTVLTIQNFYAPVVLPQGAKVQKVTLYGYRDDALATLGLRMYRSDRVGNMLIMADMSADWTDGYGSIEDTTIDYDTIDNETYTYDLMVSLSPNDDVNDVRYTAGVIEWS